MGEGGMSGRVLVISDACVATGYARVMREVASRLVPDWDLHMLGIGYTGDPHDLPFQIYPAGRDGDVWGMERARELTRALRPDVVLVQHDPWVVERYVSELGRRRPPVVGWLPVDGKNCQGARLDGLAHAIFYTDFGRREALLGGYGGLSDVVGLGVDAQVFIPGDRMRARAEVGLLESCGERFVVGAFNRNQPRKRIDLTISFFAQWVRESGADAMLYLHMAADGDHGWDVAQLARHFGVGDRVVTRDFDIMHGLPDRQLAACYAACDLHMTTTQGEGFGLTTLEGMACGIAQVVPDWSALGDWARLGAVRVPCSEIAVTARNINMIGGVPDRRTFVDALARMHDSEDERFALGVEARALAGAQRFGWDWVARRIGRVLTSAARPQTSAGEHQTPALQEARA